jgi:hypothetical protein
MLGWLWCFFMHRRYWGRPVGWRWHWQLGCTAVAAEQLGIVDYHCTKCRRARFLNR